MAAADLALTYTELRRWVARQVGADPTPGNWSSAETNNFGDMLKSGYRRFYFHALPPGEMTPHVWSFLKTPALTNLEVYAPYSTGTVEVAADAGGSEVTLTSGTWPSWAADGELYVDGGWYTVKSRTDDDTILLDDTSVTVSSGTSYTLVQREYSLPDDFGGMVEPFSFRRDQTQWSDWGTVDKRLQQVNEALIRSVDDANQTEGPPEYFAIVSVAPTSTQETKQAVLFSPTPDQTYQLWYRYMVVPPALDGTTNVYCYGAAQYSETLLLSCLDAVLQGLYDDDSKHQAYLESMTASVRLDRLLNGPTTLGKMNRHHSHGTDRRDYIRRLGSLDTTGYNL